MLDEYNELRNFWTPLLAGLLLLGVYLVILGIAIGGLVSAMRNRDREKADQEKGR